MSYLNTRPFNNSSLPDYFPEFFPKSPQPSYSANKNFTQVQSPTNGQYINSNRIFNKPFLNLDDLPTSPKAKADKFYISRGFPLDNNSLSDPPIKRISSAPFSARNDFLQCEKNPASYCTKAVPVYQTETVGKFLGKMNFPQAQTLGAIFKSYTSIRTLPQSEEALFNALSYAFFEKLYKMNSSDLAQSPVRNLFESHEWAQSQTFLFHILVKSSGEESLAKINQLYETLSKESTLTLKGNAAFKEIFAKILRQIDTQRTRNPHAPYQWMNEFGSLTKKLIQRIVHLLQINLKIFISSSSSVTEEKFTIASSQPMATSEFAIFYNKVEGQAYLLSYEKNNGFLKLNIVTSPRASYETPTMSPIEHLNIGSPKSTFENQNIKIFSNFQEKSIEQQQAPYINTLTPKSEFEPKVLRINSPFNSSDNKTPNVTRTSSEWSQYLPDSGRNKLHLPNYENSDASLSDLPLTPDVLEKRLSGNSSRQQSNEFPVPSPRDKKNLLTLKIQPSSTRGFSNPFHDKFETNPVQTVQTPNRVAQKGKGFMIPEMVRRKSLKDLGIVREKPLHTENKMVNFFI